MNKNTPYYVGFSHFLGIGPIRFKQLALLGGVKEAYFAPKTDLEKLLGAKIAERFIDFRLHFDLEKKLQEIERKKIQIVIQEDKDYPGLLKNISDPPICLYVRGEINILKSDYLFAIVGTRKPTAYGQQIVKIFSSGLATYGLIIVSGLALGVDGYSHRAALDARGKTIAVLGCGVDIIYPAINRKLYFDIIECGGAIVSEFPPGQLVKKGLFIARNRIISGLSKGVLVIEGLKDSGSLVTAGYAAEQGREVFAPPVPITSEMSAAPNFLLREGAKLAISIDDIFNGLGIQAVSENKNKVGQELSGREKNIFNLLKKEPMLLDEVAYKTKLGIEEILNTISILEIKGIVEKGSEGKYQLRFTG